MVVVDCFAEAYLGLLSGGHIVALKLLYRVLWYLSQGHDTMSGFKLVGYETPRWTP